ncbi:interleukin 12 receptor, beta 2a, like isoform X2 [Triplophysa dalaica]|uniref:interleukin 12 receptor, beta 2a, like isoform X2 n=1 Tax=Triplophysa dalaica TaxID=1582913 RepID=UPI0024DFDA25|nr:interleukin 12 receptor, beta 2a, like isoform X2 [Triplophysa dalaica]
MALRNVILFFILVYMWMLCRAFEVEVKCWYNQALPVGANVSVLCHTSLQGRPAICGLCQIDVMIFEQRHHLPSACTNISETHAISIAFEHKGHVRCMLNCLGNTLDRCNVTVLGGIPPNPPSRPNCSIEDLEERDIHCIWSGHNKPSGPTIYTLHWQDFTGSVNFRESEKEHAIIKRAEYTEDAHIKVWVTARNVLGTANSKEHEFNTGHIIRPDTPNITSHTSHPLEIFWEMECETEGESDIKCQVQYHADDEKDWTEVDDYQLSFLLEDPRPFTVYQLRVRCFCKNEQEVISHWSSVYSVRTPPAAPVGTLDVWSDCTPYSETTFCNVFWKEMPVSQARGEVNNYIVTLKLVNGTDSRKVTRQRRDTESQRSAEQGCGWLGRFPLHLGVMGVFVSANTSMGLSDPTFFSFPVLGQLTSSVNFSVIEMNQNLRVSWSAPSGFSENIQEYVVQHVSLEPSHPPCLNWVRVNKTQSFVTLAGQFRNYTAYNVSLFAVIRNSSTFLKSAVAYTLQGVPPEVPKFHVKNISHSSVTLIWSHIPVHASKGVILQYSLGLNEDTVVNVSSDITSYKLSELQPAQQYQAWVSAVTAAGEGARSITTFSTADKSGYLATLLPAVYTVVALFALILLAALLFVFRSYVATFLCGEIPDPTNSKSFKLANFQHVWSGLFSPSESELRISELEVEENLIPIAVAPTTETTLEKHSLDTGPQQDQIPDGVHREVEDEENIEESVEPKREIIAERDGWGKDYSEMVDTDEDEGGGGDDDDEEWVEQHCVSDYERHFMPTV